MSVCVLYIHPQMLQIVKICINNNILIIHEKNSKFIAPAPELHLVNHPLNFFHPKHQNLDLGSPIKRNSMSLSSHTLSLASVLCCTSSLICFNEFEFYGPT